MTGAVAVVPGERRLAGDGWSMHAERVEVLGGGWRALIGIRRGLMLLVTGTGRAAELEVDAWAGEPAGSDGVAVVDMGDAGLRIAPVPLCGCGERGCGNAGVQLAKPLAAGELPALAALLRELPWGDVVPTRSNVLRGGDLAALPLSPTDTGCARAPGMRDPAAGR